MAAATLDLPPTPVDEFDHYEIVNGQRVELPPMGHRAARIASDLNTVVKNHCVATGAGWSVCEAKFRIPTPADPDRVRKPDVAFVSFDRWPADRDEGDGDVWDVVPDLVAEIASPTDTAHGLRVKVREYLAAGVRRVWVIEPQDDVAMEHTGPRQSRQIFEDDELDGGDVLPNFKLRLSDLLGPPRPPDRG